ncbi:MAG: M23 family metallopeptidase [Myxococcota bacterium]
MSGARRPEWALVGWLLFACAHTTGGPPPRVHVVAPGDTPAAIARRYGVDVDKLMAINRIEDPRRLAVGARLVLPRPDEPEPPPLPGPGVSAPAKVEPEPSEPPRRDPPPVARPSPSATPSATPSANPSDAPPSGLLEPSPPPEPDMTPAILPAPPPGDLAAMRETFARSKAANKAPFIWPVDGVVVSLFGSRGNERHDGIDIGAPMGSAVWASAAGKVLFAGEQKGYGLIVLVAHEGGVVTIYAHNAANLVKTGDRVEQGDPIAQVGQSGGQRSPALHFELRRDKKPENPLGVLPP